MHRSRLANLVLACFVAREERQHLLGDLAEEYVLRCAYSSRASSNCWYWGQVLRSIPWLLWSPVRRDGVLPTLRVALAACAVQAAIEMTVATLLPAPNRGGTHAAFSSTLAIVLGSVVIVSCVASRIRAGAGTVITLIAIAGMLARSLHAEPDLLHLSDVLERAAAPSAAFVGAAAAVNIQRPHSVD